MKNQNANGMKSLLSAAAILVLSVGQVWAQDEVIAHPPNNNPKLPTGWRVHDMDRPQPKLVEPAKSDWDAPADAIILFDGTDLSKWNGSKRDTPTAQNPDGKPRWKVQDGYMEVTPTGGLNSKQKFGDIQLHLEWATPLNSTESAQRRGNSGVFLMGRYEIQIMDGFENTAYADGTAGSVYAQTPPLVNVSRKPAQWQSFDILFTAPRFEDKQLVSPGRVTVFQNGVVVQYNTEILGPTKHNKCLPYSPHADKLPIVLQNHGEPNRFRNIWVREL